MANDNFLQGEVHEDDGFMEAFHGGGEWWEVCDALRRIESRIWDSACESECGHSDEQGYFDAYDLVKELRESIEDDALDAEAEDDAQAYADEQENNSPRCVW